MFSFVGVVCKIQLQFCKSREHVERMMDLTRHHVETLGIEPLILFGKFHGELLDLGRGCRHCEEDRVDYVRIALCLGIVP